MYEYYQFYSPTKVVFGVGLLDDFSSELATLKISRPLLVSDHRLNKLGYVERAMTVLRDAGLGIINPFLEIDHDAPLSVISRLAEYGLRNKIDSIIALGGGSVIDTAKAANILITHGGDLLSDYAGIQTVPSRLKPLVVIPTTAGTGSEVTSAAVVLDQDRGVKHSFVDDYLKPNLAILDPGLTIGLPAKLTSATGIDAFSHALEAFTSPMRSPVSDALATESLRLIKSYLVKVLDDPENLHYRSEMMSAATLAGKAFDNAMVGIIHGIAHALGGLKGIHHGEGIFLAMPVGVRYNMEASKDRYAELARRINIASSESNNEKAASLFYNWLEKWRKELADKSDLPLSFSDRGVGDKEIDKIAAAAANDGTSFYNPREVVSDQLASLLTEFL